ncbi:MAG: response regulator [Tissierellales bacterium]
MWGAFSGKPKVLCVDDQYGIRALLKEILKLDYDVMTVGTGEEAMEGILRFDPQVVILDMKLDKMKGTEVLKFIKQVNRRICTIMITGYQDSDMINEIKGLGPEKIITKPFDTEQIRNSVKELVQIRKEGHC